MNFASRTWRVALAELNTALKSRRALVTMLLFAAVAALVMYGTISLFAKMETELLKLLQLPDVGTTGSVTMTLWKSEPFSRMVSHAIGDSTVFADIRGRHPIVLAYAAFIFAVSPLVTLIVSAPSVAGDVRSGTVRYMLVRVGRTEWSLGKFLGEAMMLFVAMLVGAVFAWAVAVFELPGWDGLGLLPGIVDWTVRAWVYAFAFLGMFIGCSHFVKSAGKATALAILVLAACAVLVHLLPRYTAETGPLAYLDRLDAILPQSAKLLMWRRSPAALFQGAVHLLSLGFLYMAIGAEFFRRRDV